MFAEAVYKQRELFVIYLDIPLDGFQWRRLIGGLRRVLKAGSRRLPRDCLVWTSAPVLLLAVGAVCPSVRCVPRKSDGNLGRHWRGPGPVLAQSRLLPPSGKASGNSEHLISCGPPKCGFSG